MSEVVVPAGSGPWRLLQVDRRFRRFFLATAASNVGTWAQSIALAIVVYDATGSVGKVAAINLARYLGSLVLAPASGVLADRWQGAAVLAVAQVCSGTLAVVLFVDFVATGSSFGRILVLAVGMGLFDAVSGPAMQAMLPSLVAPDGMVVAIALNSTSFNVARVVGPMAGALLLAIAGPSLVFAVNAVSYALLAAVAFALWDRVPIERDPAAGPMRAVLRIPGLRPLLALTAVVSLAIEPISTLTPAVAARGLGYDAGFAGVLVGIFGTGAVLAAFVLVNRAAASGSNAAISAALLAIPLGMVPMWLDAGPVPVALGLVVSGAGFLEAQALPMARLHLLASDRMRGRVMGLWSACYLGARPVASALTGAAAERFGYRAAGALVGLPAVAAAALLARSVLQRGAT